MPELRALERAMRKIEPELGTRWAPQLEKYWSQYNLDLAITSQGMTVVASDRMSLSVAACHSLHVLSVIPVVTLQLADKSARILADGALHIGGDPRPDTASWSCRSHDLIAIALMIGRFADVAVTAPFKLMEETEREFHSVEPMPKSRSRK